MTDTIFPIEEEWFDFRWEEESGCEEYLENLQEFLDENAEQIVVNEILVRNT